MGNYTKKSVTCRQCGDKFEHYAVKHLNIKDRRIYCDYCKCKRMSKARLEKIKKNIDKV